jgi:hypothetical protein
LKLLSFRPSSTIVCDELAHKSHCHYRDGFPLRGLLAKAERPSLVERLGYKATDKLLIINGDDAGMCHAANVATIDSLERGLMTSATIMVPCPWFLEIAHYAKANPNKDFGVHLRRSWGTYGSTHRRNTTFLGSNKTG